MDSVRGYRESAASGDQGLRGLIELRSDGLAAKEWSTVGALTAHGFIEAAVTALRQPLPGQRARARLLGAGFGLRLAGKRFGTLALDLAWPLLTLDRTERGEPRLHGSASIEF